MSGLNVQLGGQTVLHLMHEAFTALVEFGNAIRRGGGWIVGHICPFAA